MIHMQGKRDYVTFQADSMAMGIHLAPLTALSVILVSHNQQIP